MRVSVDRELCMGNGNCQIEAPDVFALDDAGYVELLTSEPNEGSRKAARQAAEGCPAGVIQIHEE